MPRLNERLAVFLPGLYEGGAERVMLNLSAGMAERGYEVDMVLARAEGPYMDQVPSSVRVVELNTSHCNSFRTTASLPALVRYLRREEPCGLLSGLNANLVALLARRLAGRSVRVVITEHNTFSFQKQSLPYWGRAVTELLVKLLYPWADKIVAVSEGVADDLAQVTGIPRDRIQVIYNPVVNQDLLQKVNSPLSDPWFEAGEPPVILAVGRLTEQKDLGMLIRAFAEVRRTCAARLLILGEGEDRQQLEGLVRRLSLERDVRLHGFTPTPYAFMARAALFVLSSRWEGLPTVLVEALACGTPVVSTDCPSGPREILRNGQYGTLVPVGDEASMARAIERSLNQKPSRPPRESWQPYTLESVLNQYLTALLGT